MDVTIVPARDERERVETLDAAWRAATGSDALNEAVWIDLAAPGPDSAAFFARRAGGTVVGYVHVARADNETGAARMWSLGLVVDPAVPDANAIAEMLLDTALPHVDAHGGGTIVSWRAGEHAIDRAIAAAGFTVERELYQMRAPLPIAEAPVWPEGVTLRRFIPGRDDAEWIAVNNRAFAGHAEQGNWDDRTLRRRIAEPWFDPTLFFLAVDSEGIAGFNWCKLHAATGSDPALGEIFVIGVDNRARGLGLGRPLALAGLGAMADRGITTGMLYVAADNAPALRLYRALGFDVHEVNRAYERTVSAST